MLHFLECFSQLKHLSMDLSCHIAFHQEQFYSAVLTSVLRHSAILWKPVILNNSREARGALECISEGQRRKCRIFDILIYHTSTNVLMHLTLTPSCEHLFSLRDGRRHQINVALARISLIYEKGVDAGAGLRK